MSARWLAVQRAVGGLLVRPSGEGAGTVEVQRKVATTSCRSGAKKGEARLPTPEEPDDIDEDLLTSSGWLPK